MNNKNIRDCEKEMAELAYNIMLLEYDHAEQNAIRDLACNAINDDGESGGMFDTMEFAIFKVVIIGVCSVYFVISLIVHLF